MKIHKPILVIYLMLFALPHTAAGSGGANCINEENPAVYIDVALGHLPVLAVLGMKATILVLELHRG